MNCKKLVLLLLIPVSLFGQAFEPYYHNLIHPNQKLSDNLKQLLILSDIDPNQPFSKLVEETQSKWLRRSQERWQENNRFLDLSDEIMPLLDSMGCIAEVKPKQMYYDYAIILGATVGALKPKFAQLIRAAQKGVKFKTVVFIGADWEHLREGELDKLNYLEHADLVAKSDWVLPQPAPKTEYEFGKALVDKIQFPQGIQEQGVVCLSCPPKQSQSGKLTRPTTQENFEVFLNHYDVKNKSCLIFSIQPHVGQQDTLARGALPQDCLIETVGPATELKNTAVYMDSVARWMYQYQKLQQQ